MNWILTKDEMPPKGKWVLITTTDWQKPIEIKCFMGRMKNRIIGKTPKEDTYYEYNAWTRGWGDISSEDPIAWMPLPELYKAESEG